MACRPVAGLANPCMQAGSPVDEFVTLQGNGTPYSFNAWTGAIVPIAQYERSAGSVTVRVELATDDSTIIALVRHPETLGLARQTHFITQTTADAAVVESGSIQVRSAKGGRVETHLDNGRTITSDLAAAPGQLDLSGQEWRLVAEDWVPEKPYGTLGSEGALTDKRSVAVMLTGLKPWPEIPELKDASGLGTYTTWFDLSSDWDSSCGADISLGGVVGSFALSVNGHEVPVDQLSAVATIGPFLHGGRNEISVRVATTLNNRLASLDTQVAQRGMLQNYGLMGPVRITPYRQAIVWPATR